MDTMLRDLKNAIPRAPEPKIELCRASARVRGNGCPRSPIANR
jgi:hypothetical protein